MLENRFNVNWAAIITFIIGVFTGIIANLLTPLVIEKEKSHKMGNPAGNNEASLLTASKKYISGKLSVEELKKAQRAYAPELFKEVRRPPLHGLIGEVIARMKGNS